MAQKAARLTSAAGQGNKTLGLELDAVSIRALEDRARAFMVDDDGPFVSMDDPAPKGWEFKQWPYKATRMRRMRDGSLQPVEVEVHPDPRVQAVHEQVREAELLQAVDRLRSVWHQRQIVLLNDLCLNMTYDVVYRHKDIVAGGSVIDRLFRETGFVPLSPADLHGLYPGKFKTPKAAERALRNSPLNLNGSSIWKVAVVRYRREGQHGPEARLLINPNRHPDVQAAAIEKLPSLQSVNGVPCSPVQAQKAAPVIHAKPPQPGRTAAVPRSVPFWQDPPELPPAPPWRPPA
jgi:hypothetical protein